MGDAVTHAKKKLVGLPETCTEYRAAFYSV